jgi:D-arabinose 1-dehydrogenase-like Zn-dependent alcohol dehydrogenase
VMKATGGVHGVCDFVGSEASLAFSTGVLAKGGQVVITGLIGGGYATPVAMFVLRAMTIEGVLTGTLAEAEELMGLARDGRIPAVPIAERPRSEAQAALDDLRAGRIVGRVVLTG